LEYLQKIDLQPVAMPRTFLRFLLLLSFLPFLAACSTELDLTAPYKDIWVVYGVLDQADSLQYIRISKAFLTDSDALDYARDSSLDVKGLDVTLSNGSDTYVATEVDSILKDPATGIFYPYVSLYRFETSGNRRLEYGNRYSLTIRDPKNPDFMLLAYTWVPNEPAIRSPRLVPCSGQAKALQALPLDFEFKLEFVRQLSLPGTGKGFEVRAFLDYKRDGIVDTAVYGPTQMFTEDYRCNGGSSVMCYQFREKEIVSAFKSQLDQAGAVYTYKDKPTCDQPENLPTSFWFEVTAVDTFLTNYLTANDPKFQDFNTVRPEYTNLSGTSEVIGIFGSISRAKEFAGFDDCTKFLIGLNDVSQPRPTCD
jgi:hypothetical protein